jgi:hypothetical protein
VKQKKMMQEETKNPFRINDLPYEILCYIFSFLLPHELLDCMLVCKAWNEIANDKWVSVF